MTKEPVTTPSEPLIRALFTAGAHFGYSKTRNHPGTRDFIFGYKNRSAVIDLEHTAAQLGRAREFIAATAATGKQIIIIGNKDEARALVERVGRALDVPFVASRWLGGTLTNFSQIKSRIDRLAELKQKRDQGELAVYTKKEQLGFEQEIARLERYLGSLSNLTAIPAAVVVMDSAHEQIVVREARQLGVPIVSLSNTDCDLRGIAYPIIANDGSAATIKLVLDELAAGYQAGLAAGLAARAAAAAEPAAAAVVASAA